MARTFPEATNRTNNSRQNFTTTKTGRGFFYCTVLAASVKVSRHPASSSYTPRTLFVPFIHLRYFRDDDDNDDDDEAEHAFSCCLFFLRFFCSHDCCFGTSGCTSGCTSGFTLWCMTFRTWMTLKTSCARPSLVLNFCKRHVFLITVILFAVDSISLENAASSDIYLLLNLKRDTSCCISFFLGISLAMREAFVLLLFFFGETYRFVVVCLLFPFWSKVEKS